MTGRVVTVAIAALLALAGGSASIAQAQSSSSAVKEASKRFQRGVALYGEADYRAALVEFKKAYEIAPNATVLYNIGQTYYQLQNYAAALTTLERYLSEAGAAASHRTEVEQTLDILQSRVGRVSVTSNLSACEITIDDEHVGKTPLREPVLVSIGRRKATAACEGRPTETRYADVAAGDTVPVQFSFSDASVAITGEPAKDEVAEPANWSRRMWIATGVSGGLALIAGGLAFKASRDLDSLRNAPPAVGDMARDARIQEMSDKSAWVSRLSLGADILGVVALVSGGIALKLTLSKSESHEVSVGLVPSGFQIAGSFR